MNTEQAPQSTVEVNKGTNFETLQRQFDDLRKLVELRNAEIAELKAKVDAPSKGG